MGEEPEEATPQMDSIVMPTRKTMEKLATAAKTLNRKSDELNAVIEEFEQALETAGVGVTVWLDRLLDRSAPTSSDGEYTAEGWQLGYTKLEGKWRLAVREATEVSVSGNFNEDADLRDTQPAIPLANAPRVVRMQAAGYFENLALGVTMTLESYATSIDEAKQIAKGED